MTFTQKLKILIYDIYPPLFGFLMNKDPQLFIMKRDEIKFEEDVPWNIIQKVRNEKPQYVYNFIYSLGLLGRFKSLEPTLKISPILWSRYNISGYPTLDSIELGFKYLIRIVNPKTNKEVNLWEKLRSNKFYNVSNVLLNADQPIRATGKSITSFLNNYGKGFYHIYDVSDQEYGNFIEIKDIKDFHFSRESFNNNLEDFQVITYKDKNYKVLSIQLADIVERVEQL